MIINTAMGATVLVCSFLVAAALLWTTGDGAGGLMVWPPEFKKRCGLCVDVHFVAAKLGGVKASCSGFFEARGDSRKACADAFASSFSSLLQRSKNVDHGDAAAACALVGFCERKSAGGFSAAAPSSLPDVRVAKGFGTKPYDQVRVSVISQSAAAPSTANGFEFDYSAPFKYRWTNNTISSSMVSVENGRRELTIGGAKLTISVPSQGQGVAGVFIADPCISSSSITGLVGCWFGKKFQTEERIPALLNMFAGDGNSSFWGVLGDNWYDRTGEATKAVFEKIDMGVKSKIFLTVAGNHDYWIVSPTVSTTADQYGNGHFQWYAQDSKAAENLLPGATHQAPFNYSIDPSKGHSLFGGNLPAIENGFYYNQIGNLGFIGFSGAYTYAETLPLLTEACAWAGNTGDSMKALILVGHWDTENMGAQDKMDVPTLYDSIKTLPGCDAFEAKKTLKFLMGHTHCNVPHPHGHNNTGFMIAGQGMEGCGNFGVPVLDSTENRLRLYYFPIVAKDGTDTYDAVSSCVISKGWRACLSLAETWLDQTI